MRIRALNHSTYQHYYHIVWGTKYRRKYLKHYVKPEVVRCFHEVVENLIKRYILHQGKKDLPQHPRLGFS